MASSVFFLFDQILLLAIIICIFIYSLSCLKFFIQVDTNINVICFKKAIQFKPVLTNQPASYQKSSDTMDNVWNHKYMTDVQRPINCIIYMWVLWSIGWFCLPVMKRDTMIVEQRYFCMSHDSEEWLEFTEPRWVTTPLKTGYMWLLMRVKDKGWFKLIHVSNQKAQQNQEYVRKPVVGWYRTLKVRMERANSKEQR